MNENIPHLEDETREVDSIINSQEGPVEAGMEDLTSAGTDELEPAIFATQSLDALSDEEYDVKVKRMRKTVLTGVILIAVVILIVLGLGLWNAYWGVPNKVIATIGETEFTVAQYQTRGRYYRWQLLQEYARVNTVVASAGDYDGNQYATLDLINTLLTVPDELSQRILDSFIEDVIIQQKAGELGITISEEQVEKEFYDRLAAVSPNLGEYTEEMYQQDYADYLAKNEVADLSEADLHAMRSNIMLRTAVFDAVTCEAVGEAAAEEQVWVRHILVEDQATAISAKELIESSEYEFGEIAALLSMDESTAANGGDLGWFGRGVMVPDFEAAVFALEVGEISDPIQTNYGFHIVEMMDRKEVLLTEDQINAEKKSVYDAWLKERYAELAVITDETLIEKYTPMEPSFNDPEVFEALFGISVQDTQATSEARWEE